MIGGMTDDQTQALSERLKAYRARTVEDDGGCIVDGISFDDDGDALQIHVLGFCGCGQGDQNLVYIMRGLEWVDYHKSDEAFDAWYPKWRHQGERLFGRQAGEYFFAYWADSQGLTEHGGSVPGWLTPDGADLLEALREWHKDAKEPALYERQNGADRVLRAVYVWCAMAAAYDRALYCDPDPDAPPGCVRA